MPARVRRVNRQSSSRLHIFFPHHSRATAPRDAASARHRSSSSPSTRICTVSSASRTRPNRAPTLPFFSFNATISRQDGESLVSLRSTRPRAPVRRPSPPRSRRRSRARDASFPSSFDFSPVSRARLSRARSRAHRTARTRFRRRHGRRRLSLRRARHRAASAECGVRARGRSPPNPRVDGVFIFYRSRDRDRDRGFDAHTAAIDRDRGPRARARPDRPTADRRPPTRRVEARRRRGDAEATGRGATARRGRRRARARTSANERERARTSANERERTRTNARSVRRPTDDARARDGASHRIPSRLDYPKYSRWIRWSGRRARDRTVRCTNGGM